MSSSSEKHDKISSAPVIVHDYFNVVSLLILVSLDFYYLFLSTKFSEIGTPSLGSGAYERQLFGIILQLFAAYLVTDTIWILMQPAAFLSSPVELLIHHAVTAFLLLSPAFEPQFQWHAAICISVEFNTLSLISKRRVRSDSLIFHVLTMFFFGSWLIQRLILFPILVYFFYTEWQRYTIIQGTPYNIAAASPIFIGIISFMNYMWTIQLLSKKKMDQGVTMTRKGKKE